MNATDIAQLRAELDLELDVYLEEPNPPREVLHLNYSSGVGKTYETIKKLQVHDDIYEYLVPNHNLGSEMINRFDELLGCIQVESRERLCVHDEYKELSSKYGVNIKIFCPSCNNFRYCEYYDRIRTIWKEPQSWVGVHGHLGGLANSYAMKNKIDVIVIDECFLNSIFKACKFGRPLLDDTHNLLNKMEDTDERNFFQRQVMKEFYLSIQEEKPVKAIEIENMTKMFVDGRGRESLISFAEQYEIELAKLYFESGGRAFRNIVTPVIFSLLDIYNRSKNGSVIEYTSNVFQAVFYNTKNGQRRKFIDMERYDIDAVDVNCKVIVLDATTPTAYYSKIFRRKVRVARKEMPINSIIYQTSTAKYPMYTIDKSPKTKERLLNIVNLVVQKHGKILVGSRAKYEKEISCISPNIVTAHFPSRGTNEYQEIDTSVLFGTPEPNPKDLKRKSVFLNVTEGEMRFIMRETEMLQFIHRTRPTLKPDRPTYFYILSKVDLGLPNVKWVTTGQLERILEGERITYATDENEDRIREDILSSLESNGEMSINEIINGVRGASAVVTEIIRRMQKDKLISISKSLRNGKKGRPSLIVKISE